MDLFNFTPLSPIIQYNLLRVVITNLFIFKIPLHIGSDFGLVHQEKTGHYYGKDGFGDIDDNSQLKMVNLAKGHAALAMTNLVTQNPGKYLKK